MADNREYEEGTIYEAGVGIYFSDGEDHTNINVEDEILAQINQNTEDIEALDTRMTTAEGNISALDGRLTTAEGDIDNLEGRMTTAEGDIDALEGRMNTAEGDITTLQGRMTTAEGDIDSLEGRMTTAESDIDALEGRMTTAEGNITSQGTRLTTAEGNITTLQGDVSGLGTRMTTAEGDIDALEGRMTTAEGDIDAVELRVTAIENDPTTVDVGTTTTGAEGTQASVTNSGTTHNAVFNFTIPKGDTGATGATGPQGPTGPAGPGVAAGGTAGQVLSKVDGTDYNTQWINPPSGGIEWEDVDYAEVKTIPTESFYWHIPEPGKKAPSSSNLTLMPFLFEVAGRGSQSLGGDIFFKREYYDTTNYMDTFVFVPSTANVDAFVMTHYKGSLWKCEPYCLFSFYSTGTFNSSTQKYTFAASNITLENVSGTQKAVLKWIGYIIYNEIGNLDIYGKLKGNGSQWGNLNDGGPAYIKVSSYVKGTSDYTNTGFNLYATWVGSTSADMYMVLMYLTGFNSTASVTYRSILTK